MKIMGIHDGHSASAALVIDGKVIAAIQEERLTRAKNQGGFPRLAIEDILRRHNLQHTDIDLWAFSGVETSNLDSRDKIMSTYAKMVHEDKWKWLRHPEKLLRGAKKKAQRKQEKIAASQQRRRANLLSAGVAAERVKFIDHHYCHAATAYFGQANRNDDILVITCDGDGDDLCASVSIGNNSQLRRIATTPHTASVAVIYSLVTYLMGFIPLEHEYKLMGMAPYASKSPRVREIADYFSALFRVSADGLSWDTSDKCANTFKLGPQLQQFMQLKRFDELCGGLQLFIEEFIIAWVKRLIKHSGIHRLALAGGLFMNVKLNKLIMELDEVDSLFIFPSCSDESNSIGAAWAAAVDQAATTEIAPIAQFYLGGSFDDDTARAAIDNYPLKKKIKVTHYDDIELRCAELICSGEVVARCKGDMEFGARALGNRSILANPDNWKAVRTINEMIKMRDFWMPFAPSMLAEDADKYLVNPKQIDAPYMILAFESKKEKLDNIIAATHPYDESCRPQMVKKEWNPDYHRLISYVKERSGEGVVLNTSFNLHGLPVVYSPDDALLVFDQSGLKYLALGNLLIEEVTAG